MSTPSITAVEPALASLGSVHPASAASGRAHLEGPNAIEVRRALGTVAPSLAATRIEIPAVYDVVPQWCRATAVVDGHWMVRFCWSPEAVGPLLRQARLFSVLANFDAGLPVPIPLATSDMPALLVYERIDGQPLTWESAGALDPSGRATVAMAMAGALAALHHERVAVVVGRSGIGLGAPRPQASSDQLRRRLLPRLSDRLAEMVNRLLDWVDDVLAGPLRGPAATRVVLHGDWHGHNLVFSDDFHDLIGVLDLEEAAIGDRHYDLRYLPTQAPSLELLDEVIAGYEQVTTIALQRKRILAWHVLTDLGDALWRTEAGVEVVAGPVGRRAEDLLERVDEGRRAR